MRNETPGQVETAFEILLEQIEEVVDDYIKASESALDVRDFATARKMTDRAERITCFRQKVDGVRREWRTLDHLGVAQGSRETISDQSSRNQKLARLPRGARTPEEMFYEPILDAVIELGGSASATDVLTLVREKMKGVLRDVDYQTLLSAPDEQRWRNTAKWARNTMVHDGRLKDASRYGIWEVTQKGRQYLLDKNLVVDKPHDEQNGQMLESVSDSRS